MARLIKTAILFKMAKNSHNSIGLRTFKKSYGKITALKYTSMTLTISPNRSLQPSHNQRKAKQPRSCLPKKKSVITNQPKGFTLLFTAVMKLSGIQKYFHQKSLSGLTNKNTLAITARG